MPFRREYGRVSDIGQLAAKAGAVEQAVRETEQNLDLQKLMLQRTAQKEHDLRMIQHDIALKQYEADLNFEAQKSQRSWELEKQMQRSRQTFDILMEKEAIDQRQQIQKLSAIQEALDNGIISEEDANALRIRTQTGTFAPSVLTGMRRTGDSMELLAAQILGEQIAPNKTLETRTVGADEIASTVTFPDGTQKKLIDGQVITTKPGEEIAPTPEAQPQRGRAIREVATQPAYYKSGWFGRTAPNIPAMKSKMFLLLDSPNLSDMNKQTLQRILSSGNDDAIRAYYDRLVENGLLQREYPVSKRQFEKLTQPAQTTSDVFEGVEFYGV